MISSAGLQLVVVHQSGGCGTQEVPGLNLGQVCTFDLSPRMLHLWSHQ